ncbi:MAG: RDD family protein [Natronospirillum sp.]
MIHTSSTSPQPSVTGLLWRRLAAFAYDVVVLVGLLMVATFPYLGALHLLTGADAAAAGDPWFRFYTLCIVFGYTWISWRWGGQTIGMKAWRIQALGQDGHRLTHRQILQRFLLGIPALLLGGVGYWWAIFSPSHLTLPEQWSSSCTRYLPKTKA